MSSSKRLLHLLVLAFFAIVIIIVLKTTVLTTVNAKEQEQTPPPLPEKKFVITLHSFLRQPVYQFYSQLFDNFYYSLNSNKTEILINASSNEEKFFTDLSLQGVAFYTLKLPKTINHRFGDKYSVSLHAKTPDGSLIRLYRLQRWTKNDTADKFRLVPTNDYYQNLEIENKTNGYILEKKKNMYDDPRLGFVLQNNYKSMIDSSFTSLVQLRTFRRGGEGNYNAETKFFYSAGENPWWDGSSSLRWDYPEWKFYGIFNKSMKNDDDSHQHRSVARVFSTPNEEYYFDDVVSSSNHDQNTKNDNRNIECVNRYIVQRFGAQSNFFTSHPSGIFSRIYTGLRFSEASWKPPTGSFGYEFNSESLMSIYLPSMVTMPTGFKLNMFDWILGSPSEFEVDFYFGIEASYNADWPLMFSSSSKQHSTKNKPPPPPLFSLIVNSTIRSLNESNSTEIIFDIPTSSSEDQSTSSGADMYKYSTILLSNNRFPATDWIRSYLDEYSYRAYHSAGISFSFNVKPNPEVMSEYDEKERIQWTLSVKDIFLMAVPRFVKQEVHEKSSTSSSSSANSSSALQFCSSPTPSSNSVSHSSFLYGSGCGRYGFLRAQDVLPNSRNITLADASTKRILVKSNQYRSIIQSRVVMMNKVGSSSFMWRMPDNWDHPSSSSSSALVIEYSFVSHRLMAYLLVNKTLNLELSFYELSKNDSSATVKEIEKDISSYELIAKDFAEKFVPYNPTDRSGSSSSRFTVKNIQPTDDGSYITSVNFTTALLQCTSTNGDDNNKKLEEKPCKFHLRPNSFIKVSLTGDDSIDLDLSKQYFLVSSLRIVPSNTLVINQKPRLPQQERFNTKNEKERFNFAICNHIKNNNPNFTQLGIPFENCFVDPQICDFPLAIPQGSSSSSNHNNGGGDADTGFSADVDGPIIAFFLGLCTLLAFVGLWIYFCCCCDASKEEKKEERKIGDGGITGCIEDDDEDDSSSAVHRRGDFSPEELAEIARVNVGNDDNDENHNNTEHQNHILHRGNDKVFVMQGAKAFGGEIDEATTVLVGEEVGENNDDDDEVLLQE